MAQRPESAGEEEEEEVKINEATQTAGKIIQNEFIKYYKDQFPKDYKKIAEKVAENQKNKKVKKEVDEYITEKIAAY